MKFLVDHQLPLALAKFLEARGHAAQHVIDVGLDTATDREIFNFAKANHLVIVSKDQDFFELATRYPASPQLIWVRLGNCRKADLLAGFDVVLPRLLIALNSGEQIVEVR